MRYALVLSWSEDDQAFIVEVPDLPGCISDGATYEEAVRNAQEAMAAWIEVARELGREIPQPTSRLLSA
ncbi:MAG: type II toxin-antitoxin system HicB family antitoxin [Dehalococcoidia bacterium]|nr:type II toxin-antitoxin system HicB family antitoxin [Dehalococcoidia bacterium]